MKKMISMVIVMAMFFGIVGPEFAHAYNQSDVTPDVFAQLITSDVTNSKDTVHPGEIVELRTENSEVYENEKGGYVRKIFAEPIHLERNGKWEKIVTQIVNRDSEYVGAVKTSLDSSFPKKITNNKPIVFEKDGAKIAFYQTSADDGSTTFHNLKSEKEVEGNKIYYKEIYPNIDLRHVVFNEEVKEDWIIHKYSGINTFTYKIKTELIASLETDGSIGFYKSNTMDEKIFELPAPVMMDSKVDDRLGESQKSNDVHYELETFDKNIYIIKFGVR